MTRHIPSQKSLLPKSYFLDRIKYVQFEDRSKFFYEKHVGWQKNFLSRIEKDEHWTIAINCFDRMHCDDWLQSELFYVILVLPGV